MRRSLADRPVAAMKFLLAGVGAEPRGRLIEIARSFNWGDAPGGNEVDMQTSQAKPFDIPKQAVWEAHRQVAANKGAPGVDEETLDEFEADLKNNLFKIWIRKPCACLMHLPYSTSRRDPFGGTVVAAGTWRYR